MFSVVADDQGYWALPGRAVKLHHGRRRDCDARLDLDRRVTRKVKEMLSQLLDRLDWAQARHIGDELSNIDRHSCECPSHRRTQAGDDDGSDSDDDPNGHDRLPVHINYGTITSRNF